MCKDRLWVPKKAIWAGNDTISEVLEKISPLFAVIVMRWMQSPSLPDEQEFYSITEEGHCITFNSLDDEDMFRRENLNSEFRFKTTKNRSMFWTSKLLGKNQTLDKYPFHVLGAGADNSLRINPRFRTQTLEESCRTKENGFRVALHHPGEIPNISKDYIRAPLNQEVLVGIIPQVFNTSESLFDYPPERRMCYLNDERYLRFFKVYTQRNCELECLSNYTKKMCGCVKFSMPRDKNTGECKEDNISCYLTAENELARENYMESSQGKDMNICNCLPLCESITYNSDISLGDYGDKDDR